MNEMHTPSEYLRKYIQPMIGSILYNMERSSADAEIVDMSLSVPDNIRLENENYGKWFNDWNKASSALYEVVLKVRELNAGIEGVIRDLGSQSAQWVVEPVETKAAG